MRIAILTLSSTLSSRSKIAAHLAQAGMEVIDYSMDYQVTKNAPRNEGAAPLGTADAYVLLSDQEEIDDNPQTQELANLLKAQNLKGKAILGLGVSSAQLLANHGLVPGLYKNLPGLRVIKEEPLSETGATAWIQLSPDYQFNAFTQNLSRRQILPVVLCTRARFVIPPGLLLEMQAQGLAVFLYCNTEGQPLPENPIAAVSNKVGNVLAMLPHPEETVTGDLLFQSLGAHFDSGYIEQVEPLCYWPRK